MEGRGRQNERDKPYGSIGGKFLFHLPQVSNIIKVLRIHSSKVFKYQLL